MQFDLSMDKRVEQEVVVRESVTSEKFPEEAGGDSLAEGTNQKVPSAWSEEMKSNQEDKECKGEDQELLPSDL